MQDKCTPAETVTGLRQTKKAVAERRAGLVWLAHDADPALTEPLLVMCREVSVPVKTDKSMQQLGKMCHIDVGCAAAALLSFHSE